MIRIVLLVIVASFFAFGVILTIAEWFQGRRRDKHRDWEHHFDRWTKR